jgi:hypothetical protein
MDPCTPYLQISYMKKNIPHLFSSFLLLAMITLFLPGCAVIGGIFKAGVWVGVLAVVLVVGIILYFVSKVGKK